MVNVPNPIGIRLKPAALPNLRATRSTFAAHLFSSSGDTLSVTGTDFEILRVGTNLFFGSRAIVEVRLLGGNATGR